MSTKSIVCCVVVGCWLTTAVYIGGRLHFARMAEGREHDPEKRKLLAQRASTIERLFYAVNICGIVGTILIIRGGLGRQK